MNRLEQIVKALADKTRLRMINLIMNRELCICQMQVLLDMSQPRISRHAHILFDAGIIKQRKDGQRVFYSINHSDAFDSMMDYLKEQFSNESVYTDDIVKLDKISEQLDKLEN